MIQPRNRLGQFTSAGETGVKVVGVDVINRRLRRLIDEAPREVARALYEEAEIEMAESKRRCPVDTGALRSTGSVGRPVMIGKDISVELSYGGPAAPYAVYVHENMEATHPVGQSKYLESVLLESRPYLAKRIARRVALNRLV